MLNNYGRENNFQELVADSLVHKPCGKLRTKGSQRTLPSCSKQMTCSTQMSCFALQIGHAQHHVLEESKRKGKDNWGCSVLFSVCPWKKITEMHLNQIPHPPWRCLQLIWSVDAVSFCVTHFFSPRGNGCTISVTPGLHNLVIFQKTGNNKYMVTFGRSHLSIRSEVFFRESCK